MGDSLFWQPATLSFYCSTIAFMVFTLWLIKFSLSLSPSLPNPLLATALSDRLWRLGVIFGLGASASSNPCLQATSLKISGYSVQ